MSLPDGVRKYSPKSKLLWHAARAKCVTASVAGALLGISPYHTLYSLWAEKSGRVKPEHDENEAMRKGRILEPAAIELAREDFPSWNFLYKRDNAFYSHDAIRIGATPDAFAFRPDKHGIGVCQIKIVSEEVLAGEWTEDDGSIVPPDWIMLQCLIEAKLTGADWGCVYVMAVGRSIKGHMIDIDIHEGVWQRLLSEVEAFWRLVDSGDEPSPDWERDAQAVAAVYRRSKPAEIEINDADFDSVIELFDDVRKARRAAQDQEEVLRSKILFRVKENEVTLTRRYRVKASSSTSEAGNHSRRITIKRL